MKFVRFADIECVEILAPIPLSTTHSDSECQEPEKNSMWHNEADIKNFCKDLRDIQSMHLSQAGKVDEKEEYFPSRCFLSPEHRTNERYESIMQTR